jgi:cyclophilin family peptidyl-prolyl cis-trans isomerase/HEAT repeat protein
MLLPLLCLAALAQGVPDDGPWAGDPPPQSAPEEATGAAVPFAALIELEAQRAAPAAFASYAQSKDAAIRARTARSLGRLRNPESTEQLAILMGDQDPVVRRAAAVALGFTPESERTLLAAFAGESDPEARAALLGALGRQGHAASLRVVLDALETPAPLLGSSPEAEAAAHAIGRMALRDVDGVSRSEVVDGLLIQLRRPELELRRQIAFALARMQPTSLLDDHLDLLIERIDAEGDPATRALLLRALGTVQGQPGRIAEVLQTAMAHPDVGVRVAALRAGAAAGWAGVADHLDADAPAVRLQAIAAVGGISSLDHRALLLPIVEAGATTRATEALALSHDTAVLESAAALRALAEARVRLAPAQVRALTAPAAPTEVRAAACLHVPSAQRLVELAVEGGELRVRTAAAMALVGRIGGPRAPELAELLPMLAAYDEQVVAVAAGGVAELLTLTETDQKAPPKLTIPKDLDARLLAALAEAEAPDPLAELLRALEASYSRRRSPPRRAPGPLRERLSTLTAHPAKPVRDAAAVLAERFGLSVERAPSPLDVVDLQLAVGAATARIRTERGDVVVELLPDAAPIAVANFVGLAQSGAFEGVRFHRVVPDFVVQAGDPRGDGLGGPGWSIPDEVSALPYDEGTLGMALAGPDTGGSQWFITLSPQPHLDGDYTVFGRVLQGMPLLQEVHEGVQIRRIEIETLPPRS